jgi:hypothetical protein
MRSLERSKAMTKQVLEVLMAALAIAVGLPRNWQPHQPRRDL